MDEEVESLALEALGGGPGGGPPTPPGPFGPWLAPAEEAPSSWERNASIAADSPTELEASVDDTALALDVEAMLVALDWPEALFWFAWLACNISRSRLC